MTDTEELIKASLAKQAERAPHSGPILHALGDRRRRSWRGLVLIVIATLVTGGVTVPLALQSSPDQPVPGPVDPPSGTPMAYTVSYLPAGYVEAERLSNEAGDSQVRIWRKGEPGLVHLMALGPTHPEVRKCLNTPEGSGQSPFIRVVHGWCLELVTDESVPAAEQQRIAASIQQDGLSVVQSPVRFGPLPADLVKRTVSVSSGPVMKVDVSSANRAGDRRFELTVGSRRQLGELDVPQEFRDLTIEREIDTDRIMRVQFSSGPPAFTQQQREEIVRDIKLEPVDLSWLDK